MITPTLVTADGISHEIKNLKGKDWRILGEFFEKKLSFHDKNFMEEQADFIANFFDGVTAEDILELPLEEIFPIAIDIRNFMIGKISEKLSVIEKNAREGAEEKTTPSI